MNEVPTYDPIVNNQEHFDPITLLPVFGNANIGGLSTSSGQPINFFIPPPEQAGFNLPTPQVQSSWKDYLPYIVGFGTIILLIVVYYIIKRKAK